MPEGSDQESSTFKPFHYDMDPDPDTRSEGGDSGYDEPATSLTTTLSSDLQRYEIEYGRQYHSAQICDHQYPLPNDEQEQERLLCQNIAINALLKDKLFLAPLKNPRRVLDVGTSMGTWAIEFADAYPDCAVTGTDISPIQESWSPPNLSFEIFDAEQPWTYPDNYFSMVHTGNMYGYSLRDWPQFLRNAFATLEPGGFVENHEFDLCLKSDNKTIPKDNRFQEWSDELESGLRGEGMTSRCNPQTVKTQMEKTGFTEIVTHSYKVPIGMWPKETHEKRAGSFMRTAMINGIYGLSARIFLGLLGWSEASLQVFLASVRKELREKKKMHLYITLYVFIGRKPLDSVQNCC